jgi:hypothetical protein
LGRHEQDFHQTISVYPCLSAVSHDLLSKSRAAAVRGTNGVVNFGLKNTLLGLRASDQALPGFSLNWTVGEGIGNLRRGALVRAL